MYLKVALVDDIEGVFVIESSLPNSTFKEAEVYDLRCVLSSTYDSVFFNLCVFQRCYNVYKITILYIEKWLKNVI